MYRVLLLFTVLTVSYCASPEAFLDYKCMYEIRCLGYFGMYRDPFIICKNSAPAIYNETDVETECGKLLRFDFRKDHNQYHLCFALPEIRDKVIACMVNRIEETKVNSQTAVSARLRHIASCYNAIYHVAPPICMQRAGRNGRDLSAITGGIFY